MMQQPIELETQDPPLAETWRPTRKLLATALLVLGLVAVVCLFDAGATPRATGATVTGALANAIGPWGARSGNPVAMQPSQPRNSAVAPPSLAAQFGTHTKTLPPLRTFRTETPPDDPTVDCWLDPDGQWDAKPEFLCASSSELNALVDMEDSY